MQSTPEQRGMIAAAINTAISHAKDGDEKGATTLLVAAGQAIQAIAAQEQQDEPQPEPTNDVFPKDPLQAAEYLASMLRG